MKYLIPQRLDEYFVYLRAVKNSSVLSIEGYRRDLCSFLAFLFIDEDDPDAEQIDLRFVDDELLGTVTTNDIYRFISYCTDELGNQPVTRSRKAAAIRGFFSFICDDMHYIKVNPAAGVKVARGKKRNPKYLTLEQAQALLNSVEEPDRVRNYCIITLFLNCGLRLAELVGLNLNDFNLTQRTLLVTGKGNKQRLLYLNQACVDAITDYLQVRPRDGLKGSDRDALFISRLNKRLGRQSVQQMVYKHLAKIGLSGNQYSVHKLRHTAATLLYQHAGVDVLVLKDMLGHENLSTTEIYTHLENKTLQKAMEKNPLNRPKDD